VGTFCSEAKQAATLSSPGYQLAHPCNNALWRLRSSACMVRLALASRMQERRAGGGQNASVSRGTFATHARLDCRLTSEAKSCCCSTPFMLQVVRWSFAPPASGTPEAQTRGQLVRPKQTFGKRRGLPDLILSQSDCSFHLRELSAFSPRLSDRPEHDGCRHILRGLPLGEEQDSSGATLGRNSLKSHLKPHRRSDPLQKPRRS
jgi:hypothetical protein